MRLNLTKKDLVNSVYMQLGFSKEISENLIEDFFSSLFISVKKDGKLKLSKFGTFSLREKNRESVEIPKLKKKRLFQQEKLFYLNRQKSLKI